MNRLNSLKNAIDNNNVDNSELYILKQETNDISFFDFEAKTFVQTSISAKIPVQSKSLQLKSGDIYVIGGINRNQQNQEN